MSEPRHISEIIDEMQREGSPVTKSVSSPKRIIRTGGGLYRKSTVGAKMKEVEYE
jgi:hypothetical protein